MSPDEQNMKAGPDALDTAESKSGRAKHENGTRRPGYLRKRVRVRKTRKRDTTPSIPSTTSPDVQNMKTGSDALHTIEKDSESGKNENGNRALGIAENMKTGSDTLGTVENESGRAKHENGTRHPRYSRKRVRERKR
jgi:hypothetical protein